MKIPKRVERAIAQLSVYSVGERVPRSALPSNTLAWLVELGYLIPQKIYDLPQYRLPKTLPPPCGLGVHYYFYAGVPSKDAQETDQT